MTLQPEDKKILSPDTADVPLCEPEIRGNEWKYIKECLDTNWVSSAGRFVDLFEQTVAEYIGCKRAVACVNGTSALHIALLISGIGNGDEVILPTLTFVAPANAITYTGAAPVFIDVNTNTWQLDVQKVDDFLRKECERKNGSLFNKHTGRTVKAVLPVHLLGYPVDMGPLLKLAQEFDLKVIEDTAESLGTIYHGRKAGSLGQVGCLSFNGNKVITTGGGGMLVMDDEQLALKARYLTTQARTDVLENIHGDIGYNYRLTNIQSAMGVAQMEMLGQFIAVKRQVAARYYASLNDVPGITLMAQAEEGIEPIFWLNTILIDEMKFGMDSRALLKRLRAQGILSRPLWHPIYSLKPFRKYFSCQIEVADRLYRDGLSLPSSVGLTEAQQNQVIACIQSAKG